MFALKFIWDHPYTFWALISLPAIPMILGLASADPRTIHQLLHPSGEFSLRFMNATMTIMPLMVLLKHRCGSRWVMIRRWYLSRRCLWLTRCCTRYFTCSTKAPLRLSGGEISKFYILTGRLAFFHLRSACDHLHKRLGAPLWA